MAFGDTHYHYHYPSEDKKTIKYLKKIMAALDDLKAEVETLKTKQAELQASLDTEQEQVNSLLAANAEVVASQATKIAELEAQIASGATGDQLLNVIEDLKGINNGITTTREDLEGTVAG